MKKFGIILLILWLTASFFCVPAYAEVLTDKNDCSGVDATNAIVENRIVTNAKSAVVFEVSSGTMMYADNIDARMYPASFVKIMTALLAIEQGALTDTVTVTKEALSSISAGAVSAKLQFGEELTLKDLIYCMLTGSANDAAAVIAVHIGGDVSRFVAMMNSRAAQLGCKDTNFVDPHGLQSKDQYTTARDMVRILSCAMESEVFAEIFGAVSYTVPATNLSDVRELRTANYLIDRKMGDYYDSRVTGGRTGVASDQSRCVAATAEKDNLQVIAIVFGAKSKFAADQYTVEQYGGFREISKLLDGTLSAYQIAQVFYEDQILAQRTVVNGDNDLVLTPAEAKTVLIPKGIDPMLLSYRYMDSSRTYEAPIAAGTVQSSVEVWYGGKCLAKVDLLARNHVSVAFSKVTIVEGGNGGTFHPMYIILPIVFIAVLIFIWYLRFIQSVSNKKAARRRTAGRRNRDVGAPTKRM